MPHEDDCKAIVAHALDHARLDGDLAALCLAGCLTAAGGMREMIGALTVEYAARHADDGVPDGGSQLERLREAILQTYLFAGFPRTLEALFAFHDALTSHAPQLARALRDEPFESASGSMRNERWIARGTDLCRRVYGPNFAKLVERSRQLSPDLSQWMLLEGYGKVLSRDLLDERTRECVIVASLVPMRVPRQLHSHLQGALNVGVAAETIAGVLDLVEAIVPTGDARLAREVWGKVNGRAS